MFAILNICMSVFLTLIFTYVFSYYLSSFDKPDYAEITNNLQILVFQIQEGLFLPHINCLRWIG